MILTSDQLVRIFLQRLQRLLCSASVGRLSGVGQTGDAISGTGAAQQIGKSRSTVIYTDEVKLNNGTTGFFLPGIFVDFATQDIENVQQRSL